MLSLFTQISRALIIFSLGIALLFPTSKNAHAFDEEVLASDIDEFFAAGAQGYLVWQYGGDSEGRAIAIDQYSFFRGQDENICQVLQEKANQYPDKFIGVNINNIGAQEFTDGTAVEHMTWLRENCGVSVVRIFAKIEEEAGVRNALEAAQASGVQIIVAIGDYSNGGGGMPQGAPWTWYQSAYQGAYQQLVSNLIGIGSHPALWGYELANEPHCGGVGTPEALSAYMGWGADIGAQLRTVTDRVGYGQMASQDATRCDSPRPGDFRQTNSISEITVTSAHYYTEDEKASALEALSQSNELGKLFYIGEAPPGGSTTEAREGEAGYDLSDFPDYGYDQTNYYLHPIKGIHPATNPNGRQVATTRSDLANQGYEAYCAAEPTTLSLDVETRRLIDLFLEANPQGISTSVESTYTLDSSAGQSPLFRDTTGTRHFTSSIEEYFGFKDVYTDEGYSFMELNTAPINSLLSQEQKCIQAVDILKNIQLMCERLEDPASCALLGNEIPNTSYNVSSLLDDVAEVIPGYRAGRIVEQCKMLMNNQIAEFAYEDPEIPVVKEALMNVPLHLDRSYRLAFLVASIEQRPRTEAFNFFSFSPDAQPSDEVLIVAFKIPDILTNKGGGETAGHHFFNDAASLTRDLLVPRDFRFAESEEFPGYDKESRDRRTAVSENANNAAVQNPDSTIYCVEGAPNTQAELDAANGSPACKDVLGKAIVDLINGNTPSCNNLEVEPVREILESASIIPPETDDPTRVFDPGYGFGRDVLSHIFLNEESPQRSRRSFTSWFDIVGDAFNGAEAQQTEANFYLVYPVGYELDSVSEVMRSSFFTARQIAELEQQNSTDRFATSGFTTSFRGGSHTEPFNALPSSGECEESTFEISVDPVTGEIFDPPQIVTTYNCRESFTVGVDEEGSGGLSILGANLGFWMRNVQLSLNSYFSNAHAYISSCRTTEEFLLGQCLGGVVGEVADSNRAGSGVVSPTCGQNYHIQAEDIQPSYESQTILGHNEPGYSTQVPEEPDIGRAMYYNPGIMNRVLANRISWGQIDASQVSDCEGGDDQYAGCVALLRAGDMGREVWLQRPGESAEGPYLVIDVAAERDIACLLERSWVVDVDWGTAERWGMQGPVDVRVCANASCQ